VPALAVATTHFADGRRYTFVLRPGVRFTANVFAGDPARRYTTDFVYSFRRILDAGGQLRRLDFRGRCWRNDGTPAIPLLWPWCPLRIHLRSRSFRSGHPHHAYAYVMPTGR
jgi:ABC-type transport system substrate-binding protein